jgi:hypothetical protein
MRGAGLAQLVYRWATSWMAEGSISDRGKRFFSTRPRPNRLWGSPSLLFNEHQGDLYPGVKRPRREPDHSPVSSVKVKNGGAIRTLPIRLHGVLLNWLSTETILTSTPYE